MNDQYWEVKHDKVAHCSKVPHHAKIWMLPIVRKKIELLMKKYPSLEWLAYAVIDKDGLVVDIVVPKQTVTGGSVNNVTQDFELHEGYKIGGVIHSHNTMGAFFSSVDSDFLNENHDFSIVVSNKGYKAVARFKTPCGAYKAVSAKIKIKHNVELNEENFLKEAETKINQPQYQSVVTPGNYTSNYNRLWEGEYGDPYSRGSTYCNNRPIHRSVKFDASDYWDTKEKEEKEALEKESDPGPDDDPKEMYFDERDKKQIEEELQNQMTEQ
jgi:proteasome lid subunit RPN8/RPN11